MSFEYPPASKSIQAGNGFYRIRAESTDSLGTDLTAVSPGDLIPINAGFSAIVVGPDSDFERYELLYPDKTAPGGIQRMPFSVGSPIIGNIAVDPSNAYLDSDGQPAQAYIRVADYGAIFDETQFVPGKTVTDLLIYTGQVPPILPTKRAPRVLRQSIDMTNKTNMFIPGFGRRSCAISMASPTQNSGVENMTQMDAYVFGIRFGYELNDSTSDIANLTNAKVWDAGSHTCLTGVDASGVNIPIDMLNNSLFVTGPRGGIDRIRFGYDALTGGFGQPPAGYFDYYQLSITILPSGGIPIENNFFNGPYLSMEVRD